MKQVVLGIGTGRCGSLSMARLLGGQPDAFFTHEFQTVGEGGPTWRLAEPLPWGAGPEVALERLELILEYPGRLVGDVSSSWLPYLEALLDESKQLRVVCLERERQQVVESFMRKTGRKHHWVDHDGSRWLKDPRWDPCFPKFDSSLTKRETIGRYWDLYHSEAARLAERYPGRIRVWSMTEALNTSRGVEDLLAFVGVPQERRVTADVKANASARWWIPEDAPFWRKMAGRVGGRSSAALARGRGVLAWASRGLDQRSSASESGDNGA